MSDAQPLLADAVDIHQWLERDSETADHERLKRDRLLGQQQPDDKPLRRVLLWWAAVERGSVSEFGQRLVHIRRNLVWILLGSGLLLGAGLSSLALTFEGEYPINLLALLGVLVVLPLSLLVVTMVFALLQAIGLHAMMLLPHWMSPGRWTLDLFERYAGLQLSGTYGQRGARGRLAFWQVVVFSQWFGVGFYIGAVLALAVLVSVSDLAFGWSTTLSVETATAYSLFSALAAPWAGVWSAAVPDADLVEASRIYRLAAPTGLEHAAILGTWWKYVLMSLLVWGLLPRVMLLLWGAWRLQSTTGAYLLEHSEITALLDRLTSPVIDLGKEQADGSEILSAGESGEIKRPSGWSGSASFEEAGLVVWNAAVPEAALRPHDVVWLSALSDDAAVATALKDIPGRHNKIVVFTKSWEPPLLEFLDVLHAIRAKVGKACSIAVIPVGLEGGPADVEDVAVWAQTVARLNDAGTYVMSFGGFADA